MLTPRAYNLLPEANALKNVTNKILQQVMLPKVSSCSTTRSPDTWASALGAWPRGAPRRYGQVWRLLSQRS